MVSVSCWFAGQCLVSVCGVGESCRGQCVMLVLCTVSVFHRFVVQRVLLRSVCHVGSLHGRCLSSVCGAESPVMVNVSCGGHAVHHVGSHVSVFHLFVVREPCRGHCHFGCGQCVMSWSVCHIVVMQCVMLVLWSVSCVGLWCERVL